MVRLKEWSAAIRDKGCDASDGTEVVDVEVLQGDMHSEVFFEEQHQLDELQRIKKPGLDQICVNRRNVEVESLAK
jgi:hypothetical protein